MDKQWHSVDVAPIDTPNNGLSPSATLDATSHGIEAWPNEARRLEEEQGQWTAIAYDVVLIALPIGLLVKAILVALFGPPVVSFIIPIVTFNEQLVTLYTVLFGTIIGTLVRRYALWKAQKGANVAELEQLHSSISLPKTLALVWSLRSFGTRSLVLVSIWAWYYIGSQAVSREYRFYNSDKFHNITTAFPNASALSVFETGGPSAQDIAKMNAQFLTAVSIATSDTNPNSETSATQNGWDASGNMLIPFRDQYIPGGKIDKHGWWHTGKGIFKYDSYIGVPLLAIDCIDCLSDQLSSKVLGEMELSTSYIHPNCSNLEAHDTTPFLNVLPHIRTVLNMTNSTTPTIQVSERVNSSTSAVSFCNLTETRVDIKMKCTAEGCFSEKLKFSDGHALSTTLFQNQTAAQRFLESLLLSGGAPSSTTGAGAALIDGPGIDGLLHAPAIFSTSDQIDAVTTYTDLMKLLNAYMLVSQQALLNNSQTYLTDVLQRSKADPALILGSMHGAPYGPQYRVDWIWLALDFVACVLLLTASVFATVLRRRTLAPDIFGYVSSLTRDNPMVQLPEGGSTLNGIERARMLKGIKVQIADISGQDGVGKVGLVLKDDSSRDIMELRKGRQFV